MTEWEFRDWSTQGDFEDGDDADWRDASFVGSPFEQQIDVNSLGRLRHRRRIIGSPWVAGPAPSAPQDTEGR